MDAENQAASLNPTMSTQTDKPVKVTEQIPEQVVVEQVAEQVPEEGSAIRNVIQSLNISVDAQEKVLHEISSRKQSYSKMDQSSESEQIFPISIATLSEIFGESNPIQSHPSVLSMIV